MYLCRQSNFRNQAPAPSRIFWTGRIDAVVFGVDLRVDALEVVRLALKERGLLCVRTWRVPGSALSSPGWIPQIQMSEYSLDDVVLRGRADGCDDLHGLTAGFAERGILLVNLGDEFRPVAFPVAEELALRLVQVDRSWLWRLTGGGWEGMFR